MIAAAPAHSGLTDAEQPQVHPRNLPGLNGLRAIAASVVLVCHVYSHSYKQLSYANNYELSTHFISQNMVNLFFVISGFIITYILQQERTITGTISLKNFYIKRALRIWPLYFLILFATYAICRYTGIFMYAYGSVSGKVVLLCSLFLVNFNSFFSFPLSVVAHYWSLSVEEQFYIFWPVLFKKSRPWIIALAMLLFYPLLRNAIAYLSTHNAGSYYLASLNAVLSLSKFSSIALGAIGAMMVKNHFNLVQKVFAVWVQAACWLILLLSVFINFYIPYFHFELLGTAYLILILNVAFNPKPLLTLQQKFLDYTGKISFGIYMYHLPIIYTIIYLFRHIAYWNTLISFQLLPFVALTFIITYAMAALSFRYFESFFLRLKPGTTVRKA